MGLEIAAAKVVRASEELLREHYANLKGTPFVDGVVKFMMGDYNHLPDHRIYAFVLRGENAVSRVRAALGATNPEKAEPWTLRGQFGCIKTESCRTPCTLPARRRKRSGKLPCG